MNETSQEITINSPGIILSSLFEILLPFILSFIWIKYFYGKITCILIGIAGFIASVFIESLFLQLITWIAGQGILFYIIAGLSPGIFEETGRYICLKYLLSKEQYQQRNISVSYGIGHGGIESILVGIAFFSNLFTKDTLIEKGILKSSITFFMCIMSAMERFFAVLFHISASVLDYKAVKEKKIVYYIIAIILHDIVDFIAFLYRIKTIQNIFVIELIIGIFSSCIGFYAYKLYNSLESHSDSENLAFKIEEKEDTNYLCITN
jgi:uncharacterized membrane protein YhfC